MTFAYAAQAYIDFRQPEPKDEKLVRRLAAWFGARDVRTIVGADLITAAHHILPGRSNATKNRHVITPASTVLHYARDQKWCDDARFRLLKVSRRSTRRPASQEAVSLLLANTDGHKRLLLALLYETGLRITDTLRLDDYCLDLPRGLLRADATKNDDGAWIGLSPELVAMLASTPRSHANRLFPWASRFSVYKWLRPLCRRLGVQYTPHLSRHAMATDLYRDGRSVEQIADRGIWRDPRSVQRYIHHRATELPQRSVAGVLGKDRGKG